MGILNKVIIPFVAPLIAIFALTLPTNQDDTHTKETHSTTDSSKQTVNIVVTIKVVGGAVQSSTATAGSNKVIPKVKTKVQPVLYSAKPSRSNVKLGTKSGNKSFARTFISVKYGWGYSQYQCLVKLWTKESQWSHTSTNSDSGAYGIPQALPASKMASSGSDWRTNPITQIKWGARYIHLRYTNPCGAWIHHQNKGWY